MLAGCNEENTSLYMDHLSTAKTTSSRSVQLTALSNKQSCIQHYESTEEYALAWENFCTEIQQVSVWRKEPLLERITYQFEKDGRYTEMYWNKLDNIDTFLAKQMEKEEYSESYTSPTGEEYVVEWIDTPESRNEPHNMFTRILKNGKVIVEPFI
jgi:hypothetical protein